MPITCLGRWAGPACLHCSELGCGCVLEPAASCRRPLLCCATTIFHPRGSAQYLTTRSLKCSLTAAGHRARSTKLSDRQSDANRSGPGAGRGAARQQVSGGPAPQQAGHDDAHHHYYNLNSPNLNSLPIIVCSWSSTYSGALSTAYWRPLLYGLPQWRPNGVWNEAPRYQTRAFC